MNLLEKQTDGRIYRSNPSLTEQTVQQTAVAGLSAEFGCGESMVWSCEVITQLALCLHDLDAEQLWGRARISSAPTGLMDNL